MASATSHYARALADVVFEKKADALQAVAQLRDLSGILSANPGLLQAWKTPGIPGEQKRAVLDALVRRLGLHPLVRNFVAVLIDHRRIPAFDNILRNFEAEVNNRLGLADAEVTAARDLREEEKRHLEARLGQMTGKRVRATYARDPKLLGGAVVRIGSMMYDGSVRGRLLKLKEQLCSN